MPTKESDPWALREADFPEEGVFAQLTFCLRYAILAPSSHNSQPWFFTADHGDLYVFADRSRALPVVDPNDRELVISCGALIGHLSTALRHFGLLHEITLLPDGRRPDLMAHVRVLEREHRTIIDHDEMFAAIPHRRTTRIAFEDRPVQRDVILALEQEVRAAETASIVVKNVHDEREREAICDLVAEADRMQYADRRFRRELAAWLHSNRGARGRSALGSAEGQHEELGGTGDGMPGFALGMSDLASAIGPSIIRTFDVGKGQAARDRELAAHSPLLCAIVSDEDSPRAWLETGRVLSGVLLRATSLGLGASYLNQPIEVPDLRSHLHEVIGIKGDPQILLRLGYLPRDASSRHTPRRRFEEVLLLD